MPKNKHFCLPFFAKTWWLPWYPCCRCTGPWWGPPCWWRGWGGCSHDETRAPSAASQTMFLRWNPPCCPLGNQYTSDLCEVSYFPFFLKLLECSLICPNLFLVLQNECVKIPEWVAVGEVEATSNIWSFYQNWYIYQYWFLIQFLKQFFIDFFVNFYLLIYISILIFNSIFKTILYWLFRQFLLIFFSMFILSKNDIFINNW